MLLNSIVSPATILNISGSLVSFCLSFIQLEICPALKFFIFMYKSVKEIWRTSFSIRGIFLGNSDCCCSFGFDLTHGNLGDFDLASP